MQWFCLRMVAWRYVAATICVALVCIGAPGATRAAPWAEVGDIQLRHNVELLKDAGVIEGPMMAWPISWSQIGANLETTSIETLSPMLQAALLRVRARMAAATEQRFSLSATVGASTEPELVRSFDSSVRADADVSGRAEYLGDRVYLSLSAGVRSGSDQRVNFDQTYGALRLGNWMLVGGYYDLWWGPSTEGAVMVSSNARPFPRIGIKRLDPLRFETPWLSWIGPWSVEAHVGVLDDTRSDTYANPIVAQLRVSIEPFRHFELGLSRTIQTCGRGRPCGLKNWVDALVPLGGADNTGGLTEPGNQQVGYDFRYARPVPWGNAGAYFSAIAEDGVGEAWAFLGGAFLVGHKAGVGTWRLGLEYADTWAYYSRFFNSIDRPGRDKETTYLHFLYRDGLSYRGRPLGYSLDGDSQSLSFLGSVTDRQNRRWSLAARHIDLNLTNTVRYRVSRNRETFWMGEAGVAWPTRYGDVRTEVRYLGDTPNTPGRRRNQAQFELNWRIAL